MGCAPSQVQEWSALSEMCLSFHMKTIQKHMQKHLQSKQKYLLSYFACSSNALISTISPTLKVPFGNSSKLSRSSSSDHRTTQRTIPNYMHRAWDQMHYPGQRFVHDIIMTPTTDTNLTLTPNVIRNAGLDNAPDAPGPL